MSDIAPHLALQTVHDGLRDDVLPRVDDQHAEATLKAALGILRHVVAQLEEDTGASRTLVAAALVEAETWPGALEDVASEAAAEVSSLVGSAGALAGDDLRAARGLLQRAAQETIACVWRDPALRVDERLIASVRAVSRAELDTRLQVAR